MKRIVLSIVSLLMMSVTTLMASNELVIHLKTGTTQRYVLLDEEPTITFEGDNIVVKTSSAEYTYAMDDVTYFNYENSMVTSIDGIGTSSDGMQINGDYIAFSGLPAGCKIIVYGTGGQVCLTETADKDGNANISMVSLASGIYIISANNISTKITKK